MRPPDAAVACGRVETRVPQSLELQRVEEVFDDPIAPARSRAESLAIEDRDITPAIVDQLALAQRTGGEIGRAHV